VSAPVRIVLCAGGAGWEAPLVRDLQHRALGVALGRRCVDHGELLGVALRDRPEAAVLNADVPWLDRDLVGALADHGITVIAVGSEAQRDRLERIGVRHHFAPDVTAEMLASRLHVIAGARPEVDDADAYPDATEARRGRLVAVWGGPGAPGRTTVASELAVGLARAGREVALIDGDAWAASVAQRLGLAEAPSVTQAARLAGDGWPEPIDGCLQPGPAGCSVLVGLARSELWPEVRERAWIAVLGAARERADVVVVDLAAPIEEDEDLVVDRSPYRRNTMTVQALREADDVLLVSAGDPIGLRRGIVAHRTVADARPEVARRTRVVVNRAPSTPRRLQDCSKQVAEWTGRPPLAFLPHEPAFDRVVWEGRPLHDVAPRSPWLRELRSLAGGLAA
jgi:MinD-like ATPase involved in chromosome partitioning or flagellar assembly